MADIPITVTIPDAKLQLATDGFLKVFPRPNGVTLKEHLRAHLLVWLRDVINNGLREIDFEAQPPHEPPAYDDGVVT